MKLVLLRHGESQWNLENRFTGWKDVHLSKRGVIEAKLAGRLLKEEGFKFDHVFTSLLKRANLTMDLCLKEMSLKKIPIVYDWRLNERHYGSLQGLNKLETAKEYGNEQVLLWRRSYNIKPPSLHIDDERHPRFDSLYKNIDPKDLPGSECLEDTVNRILPLWLKLIAPMINSGKKILIVAHGNSLRAIVKYLDNISNEDIINLNIPTGTPLVYKLNNNLKPLLNYYLKK